MVIVAAESLPLEKTSAHFIPPYNGVQGGLKLDS